MESIRTALVGCGKVGAIHAAVLAGLPESCFVAACDADGARAESLAGRFGVRAFDNLDALLADSGAEAVVIATPHPLHAEAAIRAAEAGRHVLVEKPMAARLDDCDAMLAAARSAGITLGVVSQRRFCRPVQRMRAALDDGRIGRRRWVWR